MKYIITPSCFIKSLILLIILTLLSSTSSLNAAEIGMTASSATCDASTEGAIRYVSGSKTFEGCDGTSWNDLSGGGGSVPIGSVHYFAATTPPSGYLEADGSAVSRTTYADLFAVINTMFGAGDGSTTFNLPDLRGEFIRGWDNGKGTDTGRSFGTWQADEFKSHTHGVSGATSTSGSFGYTAGSGSSSSSAATGGSETRPRNIALLPCIKVF